MTPRRDFLALARRYRWRLATGLLVLQLGAACPTPDITNVTGGGPSAPSAPSSLAATPSSATQINLSWTDNSTNEDGFRIERAPGGTTTFAEIGTVAAGVTNYQSTGLTGSTAYSYRVRAYNASGNSAYTATADATTMLAPPAAPSNLTALGAASTQVNITWTDNSNNEDGFRIEVTTTGVSGFSEIATVAAGVTTYQHTGLTPSTGYTYRVRSYNAAGNSAYSNSAVGFTSAPPVTPPAAPTNLAATGVGPNTISLMWTDNSDNETGFKIERAPGGTTTFTEIVAVNAGQTTYLNAGLSASTQYAYRIRAYNSAGNSAYTATATATTTGGGSPPAAPSALGATAASSSQINLAWTDNSSNEDGFKVERAPGTTSTFTEIATVGAGVTTYQNTGLTASTQFTYRVRAYNSSGSSAYSATATAATNSAGSTPAAPSGLAAAAASSAQINLTWTDNSNDEDGFRIERCTGSSCGSFAEIATVAAGVDNYQSTGLTEGTTYGFRVRAYNGAGNSAFSNTASATTETPLPTLPTNLVATATSASQINLTWNDNSTNETGFKIERCTGAACSSFAEIATVGAGIVAYQNTGLSASTLYRYRVRAYNLGGNSAYSDPAEATTPAAPTPPADPSGLGATVISSTQINLAWIDNSNNEDGFKIEGCSGVSCSSFAEITTVAAGVTTYQNTGLTASTPYSYRVRAYNAAGNSGYTLTASGTTLVAPPAAPSNLTATVMSDVQINLAWTDNASTETGFRVEVAVGGGAFNEIGTLGANMTSTPVTGLTQGTTYSFRVRAYNAGGNSGYTNTATKTTWAVLYASAANALESESVNGGPDDGVYSNNVYQTGKIAVGCNVFIGATSVAACISSALQFSGFAAAVSGKTISAAYLRLYPSDLGSSFQSVYGTFIFSASWSPSTITYNNSPPFEYPTPQSLAAPHNNYNPIDWDVTAHVQKWVLGPSGGGVANNGFLVTPTSTPPGGVVETTYFWSDDTHNGNLALRPQLIIIFN